MWHPKLYVIVALLAVSHIATGQRVYNNLHSGKNAGIIVSGTPPAINMEITTGQLDGCTLKANLGNDTVLCPGESLTMGAPAGNTYLWSTGAASQTITISTTGKYWLQVSNGACTSSDTINVSFSVPQFNLGKDTSLCQGGFFTLKVKTGVANRYLWSTGETTQTITITKAGQFWVKAFNNTCFNADTINMLVIPLPNVNLGNDTTVCQGEALTLNAGNASGYLWSTGEKSQIINVSNAGQYWINAFNGGCFKADTLNLLTVPSPKVNLGNDTSFCDGQSLVLKAGNATRYLWSTGERSQNITVNTSGQYWVKAYNEGCARADTINLTIIPAPKVNLGNDTSLCQGQSVTFNAGSASGYLWSTGATSQTINISSTGQYWVKVFYGSCARADTVNAFIVPFPNLNLGNDTAICQGQPVVLNAGIASNYLWSTGATTQTINVSNAGQYWVTAFNGSCSKTDTINTVIASFPQVNLGNDTTLCNGESVILIAGNAGNYQWSTGASTQSINVTTPGEYWVKSANSSCFKMDTVIIRYNRPPVSLLPADTTICNSAGIMLNAGKALKYLWSTGDTTQTIKVVGDGVYSVVANYIGRCTTKYSTTIKFDNCSCKVFMPTAFTPNMDGKNDYFKPARQIGCQAVTMQVFNRMGQKIFESADASKGWDGTFRGLAQDTGVYVWMIVAVTDGQQKLFKGTVMLIR